MKVKLTKYVDGYGHVLDENTGELLRIVHNDDGSMELKSTL